MINILSCNFNNFLYASVIIHGVCFFLLFLADFAHFSTEPINIGGTEGHIMVRIGQIRNSRKKESDAKYFEEQKQAQIKNDQKRLVAQKAVEQKAIEQKKVLEAANLGKTEAQKEQTPKSLTQTKQPELKQLPQNSKASSSTSNFYNNSSNISSNISKTNAKKKTQSSPYLFDSLDDIAEASTIQECKSITDVHILQFKKDVIEFVKANWNVPDYLLDKDLNVIVLIVFDKNGFVNHYEIKKHPTTTQYNDLVESIKRLLYIMTKKPLPVNGRKLRSNCIQFNFSPKFN